MRQPFSFLFLILRPSKLLIHIGSDNSNIAKGLCIGRKRFYILKPWHLLILGYGNIEDTSLRKLAYKSLLSVQ